MQTRKGSFFEQCCNMFSGLITANLVWVYIVIPLANQTGWQMTEARTEAIWIVNCIFTLVSLIRGYLWRRLFNWLELRGIVT